MLLIVGVSVVMVIARKWKWKHSSGHGEPYEDISGILFANRPIAAHNPQEAMKQEPLDSPQQGNTELQEKVAYNEYSV